MNMRYRLGLLGVLLLAGCASVGYEFPGNQVALIQLNQTSQEQIRAAFGMPWRVGMENGLRTWTYGHYQYRLFGKSDTEDLVIKFNNNGTVASYVYNTTLHSEGASVR
jgi:outer membrane protein assembly factor BamE (lipoprotein component of BamABCDE complex)